MTVRTHQTIELISVSELRGYERNARTHSANQIQQIVKSVRAFGFTNPLLIDDTGMIVAGHGRFAAARELGMEEVPCIRLTGLSQAEIRALIIADNQIALNSGWDDKMLAEEVRAIDFSIGELDLGFDLATLGLSDLQLGELNQLLAPPEEPEEAHVVELTAEPTVSRTGETWVLGAHRLTVGGAAASHDVDALILFWQRENKGEDAKLSGTSETFNARAKAMGIEFVRPKSKSQKARPAKG